MKTTKQEGTVGVETLKTDPRFHIVETPTKGKTAWQLQFNGETLTKHDTRTEALWAAAAASDLHYEFPTTTAQ